MTIQPDKCPHCPTELPPNANYCPGCGAQVVSPSSDDPGHLNLEKFFGYALDMCCIAGVDGYFKRVNQAFLRTLGYTREELLARPYNDFVHPDDRADTHAETGKLAGGTPTLSFENRYRCANGEYRILHWTSFPEPETGLLYAIARDITDQRRRETRCDRLTGLVTRQVFEQKLQEEWKRAYRAGVTLAVGMIDIDHFKSYNAAYGHDTGDERLRHLARIISEQFRRVGDLAARYDGQQFAVIMDGGLSTDQATMLCERIRATVEELEIPHEDAEPRGVFTVSAGVATVVPRDGVEPDQLVSMAESALEDAKKQGRNRVVGSSF
ncbi:MAG: diguanylate cyclase [Gemmatimonadota bacterium]|nr:MAG: diguanylate cyclase [Gemmatimonadota bacterium]